MSKALIEKINMLKKEKNAVILAHSYANVEIDEVADFVGDSLYLSRVAQKTDADIVVFAGVYFMAETAKILSPNKKVLIPVRDAGCKMADMVNLAQIKDFKAKYPNCPVVCYVNSSASVKSQADICCTSSNAIDVVKSLKEDTALFVPDRNLGSYVQDKVPNKKIICYDGCCPIHNNLAEDTVKSVKKKYEEYELLVHPECTKNVLKYADFIGSTAQIMDYVKNSSKNNFIIGTEVGVLERLKRDHKDKNFILVSGDMCCSDMKKTTLNDVYNALLNEKFEIQIDKDLMDNARNSIEKMVKI